MYIKTKSLKRDALNMQLGAAFFPEESGGMVQKVFVALPQDFKLPTGDIMEKLGASLVPLDGPVAQVYNAAFGLAFEGKGDIVPVNMVQAFMALGYLPPLIIARRLSIIHADRIEAVPVPRKKLQNIITACTKSFLISEKSSKLARSRLQVLSHANRKKG